MTNKLQVTCGRLHLLALFLEVPCPLAYSSWAASIMNSRVWQCTVDGTEGDTSPLEVEGVTMVLTSMFGLETEAALLVDVEEVLEAGQVEQGWSLVPRHIEPDAQ